MKAKILLILVLSVSALTAFAQDGGVRGRVVSRAGRVALDGVKVTMTPGDVTVMSDERGNFLIENVPAGEYSLQFETPEFEPLTIAVRVGSQVRDINAVVLVPDVPRQMIDDAVFAEFDMETVDDAQALPTSLSASKDIFNNIASYKFSEMRFNVRGYDSQYQDVLFARAGPRLQFEVVAFGRRVVCAVELRDAPIERSQVAGRGHQTDDQRLVVGIEREYAMLVALRERITVGYGHAAHRLSAAFDRSPYRAGCGCGAEAAGQQEK